MRGWRSTSSTVLIVLGTVLLCAGVAAEYAHVAFVDTDAFADRAVASLRKQPVRDYVGERVARDVVATGTSRLISARPLVEAVVGTVAGSSAFRPILHRAASRLHFDIVHRRGEDLTLGVSDAAVLVASALQSVDPKIAREIRKHGDLNVSLGSGGRVAGFVETAERIRTTQYVLLPLAFVAFLLAIAVALDRRLAFVRASFGVAIAGVILFVAEAAGSVAISELVSGRFSRVAEGVYTAFMYDLRSWALSLVVLGIVGAAVGALWAERLRPSRALERLSGWFTGDDAGPAHRAFRIALLVLAGIFAVLEPLEAARLLLVSLGAGLVALAFGQLADLVPRAAGMHPAKRAWAVQWRRVALVVGVLAVLAAGGAYLVFDTGREARAANDIDVCNGFAELCDRPLTDVTLAGTHNSMSAADEPGWFRAEHTGGIDAQLRSGVRALLVDVWVGSRSSNGIVRTDYEASGFKDVRKIDASYGPGTFARIEDLIGRLGVSGSSKRELFLCHVACEAGATRLGDGLADIRRFLLANPGEVVVIIIENHAPLDQIGKAIEQAKLGGFLYRHEPDANWPTLRELIDDGSRLLVMTETEHDPDFPWLLRAYGATQETPYLYTSLAQLLQPRACQPNRGGTGKPFFLLNNWVQEWLPSPAVAKKANGYEALLARARRCERVRGRKPTIIAVDFATEGDVFGVANTLNGLPRDARPTTP